MAQAELISIASRPRFTDADAKLSATSVDCPVACARFLAASQATPG
jgi:hypothetical protein